MDAVMKRLEAKRRRLFYRIHHVPLTQKQRADATRVIFKVGIEIEELKRKAVAT
ncbi:MAG: hypothetical protein ACREI9_05640 [Nitrospiraceae bacterium]